MQPRLFTPFATNKETRAGIGPGGVTADCRGPRRHTLSDESFGGRRVLPIPFARPGASARQGSRHKPGAHLRGVRSRDFTRRSAARAFCVCGDSGAPSARRWSKRRASGVTDDLEQPNRPIGLEDLTRPQVRFVVAQLREQAAPLAASLRESGCLSTSRATQAPQACPACATRPAPVHGGQTPLHRGRPATS